MELFTPTGSNPLANLHLSAKGVAKKVYDKPVKSFCVNLVGTNGKVVLGHKKGLSLISRYIVIQLNKHTVNSGYVEFVVMDTGGNRRRLILSPNFTKIKPDIFHAQIPFPVESGWMNCCFDLHNLYSQCFGAAQNSTYHCLDKIILGPKMQIRKIFTMKKNPLEEVFIPKKFNFVTGADYRTVVIDSKFYTGNEEDSKILKTSIQVSPQLEARRPTSGYPRPKSKIAFGRSFSNGKQKKPTSAPQMTPLSKRTNLKFSHLKRKKSPSQTHVNSSSIQNPSQPNKRYDPREYTNTDEDNEDNLQFFHVPKKSEKNDENVQTGSFNRRRPSSSDPRMKPKGNHFKKMYQSYHHQRRSEDDSNRYNPPIKASPHRTKYDPSNYQNNSTRNDFNSDSSDDDGEYQSSVSNDKSMQLSEKKPASKTDQLFEALNVLEKQTEENSDEKKDGSRMPEKRSERLLKFNQLEPERATSPPVESDDEDLESDDQDNLSIEDDSLPNLGTTTFTKEDFKIETVKVGSNKGLNDNSDDDQSEDDFSASETPDFANEDSMLLKSSTDIRGDDSNIENSNIENDLSVSSIQVSQSVQKDEVELLYDPLFDVYYNPKTNQYLVDKSQEG